MQSLILIIISYVCATVRIGWKSPKLHDNKESHARYDVSKQMMSSGETEEQPLSEAYVKSVINKAGDSWPNKGSVEDRWCVLYSALLGAADELLGLSNLIGFWNLQLN